MLSLSEMWIYHLLLWILNQIHDVIGNQIDLHVIYEKYKENQL